MQRPPAVNAFAREHCGAVINDLIYDEISGCDCPRARLAHLAGRMGRGAMHLFARFFSTAVFAGSLFVSAFCSDSALAEKRVALVVGNSNYQNVPQLPNPSSDARAIADMLTKVGFQVDLEIDVGNLAFKRAIRRFEDAAAGSDMAVVYFAGHGFEIHGVNYLIPIDARLADERDAPDEAIALDRLLEAVSPARKLALIMVDACRDNPFLVTMKRLTVSRSLSTRGLARVEPEGTDTLIAYAAKDGSTAEDGRGAHSPFTTALLDNLTIPGLDVQLAFRRVRDEVLKITDGRQEPYVYGSLGGKVISLVATPEQTSQGTGADIRQDFELAQQIGTAEAWNAFLNTYKTGFYAELAKAALAKLSGDARPDGKGPQVATLETPPPPPKVATPTDDALAWNRVKDSSDQVALQGFIARFPDSPFALDAQRRLQVLQQIAKERQAEQAQAQWNQIKNSSDQAVLNDFIKKYRDSPLAVTAQERLAAIQRAAKDQEDTARSEWAKLKSSNDSAALKSFLARYPNSALAANAQQRLAGLEQAAKALEEKAAAEWAKLRDSSDQTALQAFISRYANSPLALNAQERLAAVQQAAKAQQELARAEWDKLKDSSDQAALQAFIAHYPKSPLVSSAQDRLAQVQRAAQAEERKARAEWAKIKRSNDPAVLQSFVEHFPNSPLAANAKERLSSVQQVANATEQKARGEWDKIKGSSDPAVLQSFISTHPNLQVTADAQKRLAEVRQIAKAEEEKAAGEWSALRSSNDQAALEAFIGRYPNSPLLSDARSRLTTIRKIAKQQEDDARTEWAKVRNSNEPGDLQAFIADYPHSPLVANAQQRLTALQQIAAADATAKAAPADSPAPAGHAYSTATVDPHAAMPSGAAQAPSADRDVDQHNATGQGTPAASPSGAHDKLTMLESPAAPAPPAATLADDQQAWEQIKDSGDRAALESFIARFPNSPLSLNAQQRLQILKQAEREREQQNSQPGAVEAHQGNATGAAPAEAVNTPDLIHDAQVELRRLGCFSGDADGKLTSATRDGINHYMSQRNGEDSVVAVTPGFVAKLQNEHARVCPLQCGEGETAHGDTCVASKPTKQNETASREEDQSRRKKDAHRKAAEHEEERPRRKADRSPPPRPHVHEEVSAGHASHGGGGGTMTGVGF